MATTSISFLTVDGAHRLPALDEAVRSLVSSTFVQGRTRIHMPVVLATGSAAVVVVWPEGNGETFMVSDDGGALFEIMAGAFNETTFRAVAKERSDRYGAAFDGATMLYLRVSSGRLRGAIIAMANLVKEVVDETIERSVKQKANLIDLELWEKLGVAFSGFTIEKKAHLIGESTASYEFTAVVQLERATVAFDTFSAQGGSVNSVYVKMSDISRRETGPKGIAITRSIADVGPKLNLITSVARVAEIQISTDKLLQLALAA